MKEMLRYFVVGILGLFVGISLAYGIDAIFKKEDKKDTPKIEDKNEVPEEKEKDSIKLLNTKEENGSITQNYEAVLNTKHITFSVIYTVNQNGNYHTINGTLNGFNIYSATYNKKDYKESFKSNLIANNFEEDNFKIVKGTDDKSYLIIRNFKYTEMGNGINLLNIEVYNDELNRINTDNELIYAYFSQDINLENDSKPWYKDEYNLCKKDEPCQIRGKFYEDKFHLLTLVLNEETNTPKSIGTLEERVYTIKDNKLNYTVPNKYIVKDATGISL